MTSYTRRGQLRARCPGAGVRRRTGSLVAAGGEQPLAAGQRRSPFTHGAGGSPDATQLTARLEGILLSLKPYEKTAGREAVFESEPM